MEPFGNYDLLPVASLQQLVEERGIAMGRQRTNRGAHIQVLTRLDVALDLLFNPRTNLEQLPRKELVALSNDLGLGEASSIILQDYREGNLDYLHFYDNNKFKTYEYAHRRNNYLSQQRLTEEPRRLFRVVDVVTPIRRSHPIIGETTLTLERIEKMSTPDLIKWLDNHKIDRRGAHTRHDYIDLIIIQDPTKLIARILESTSGQRNYSTRIPLETFDVGEIFQQIEEGIHYRDDSLISIDNPIEYIMMSEDPTLSVNEVLVQFKIPSDILLYLPFWEKINFLWGFYASKRNNNFILNTSRQFLQTTQVATIRQRYPSLAQFSDVEIILILLTGVPIIPGLPINPNALSRTNEFLPEDIVKIVKYLYPPNENLIIPANSSYQIFFSQEPSPLIPFILNWQQPEDVATLSVAIGMVIPPRYEQEPAWANLYYFRNLRHYEPIYLRPDPVDPLPYLEVMYEEEIVVSLSQYTDDELISAYEVTFTDWESRPDLLEKIAAEAKGEPIWAFRNLYCNNVERTTLLGIPFTPDDPEDPTISYGTLTNYRCYQISELELAFREDPDRGFIFGVPDYIAPNLIVKEYGFPMATIPEFPLDSIRQLMTLLEQEKADYPVLEGLLSKISIGLRDNNGFQAYLKMTKQQYLRLSPEQQETVIQYLYNLFLLGMYMRFWKGPGEAFPDTYIYQDCATGTRVKDFNIELQQFLVSLDNPTREWLNSLHRVRYNFTTKEVRGGRERIAEIVEWAINGYYCLGATSDAVIETAYYFILYLLEIDHDEFNLGLQNIVDPNQPPFNPPTFVSSGY